jgi:hypothetical protein
MITPFVSGIGFFEANNVLPNLRKLYVDNADVIFETTDKVKTTLNNYGLSENSNCLIDDANSNAIKNLIVESVKTYAIACGFADTNLTPKIVNFWLNEQDLDVANPPHNHTLAHFSGCIYVDMPVGCSGIYFVSPTQRFDWRHIGGEQNLNAYNAKIWEYLPTEGQMLIWQSWMQHGVNPAKFEGTRRSVAFDVVMQNKIGAN